MNVAFEYLYRDGANYKNWGEVVFSATPGLDIEELDGQIRRNLIDGAHFVAENLDVPVLYFAQRDIGADHWWHEYSGVSWTDKLPTQLESIEQFIHKLNKSEIHRALV